MTTPEISQVANNMQTYQAYLFKAGFAEILSNVYPSFTFQWSSGDGCLYLDLQADTVLPLTHDFIDSIFENLLDDVRVHVRGVVDMILPASFRENNPALANMGASVPSLQKVHTTCKWFGTLPYRFKKKSWVSSCTWTKMIADGFSWIGKFDNVAQE
jgi:hypothetical protein